LLISNNVSPLLSGGDDIVVADNVSFHKVARRGGVNQGPRGRSAILAAVFAGPQSNCISIL
jgi:hypothetical protein